MSLEFKRWWESIENVNIHNEKQRNILLKDADDLISHIMETEMKKGTYYKEIDEMCFIIALKTNLTLKNFI